MMQFAWRDFNQETSIVCAAACIFTILKKCFIDKIKKVGGVLFQKKFAHSVDWIVFDLKAMCVFLTITADINDTDVLYNIAVHTLPVSINSLMVLVSSGNWW